MDLESDNIALPIFPLNRVVFPDSVFHLQIFEQRYLDMVSTQLKKGQGFVTSLIKKGNETGIPAEPFNVGTYVEIVDFGQRDNGLLMISCLGKRRVAINSTEVLPNKLIHGNVSWLAPLDETKELVDEGLRDVLIDLAKHPEVDILDAPEQWEKEVFVLERLTEYLPISERQKQSILEQSSIDMRKAMLYQTLAWLK